MNIGKFVEVVKHFETIEPQVLAEIQAIEKAIGPALVAMFPQFAGYETELEHGLDFLSRTSGTAFLYLDKALALLAAFTPKA